MTNKKLIEGTACAVAIAACGFAPMLFGYSLQETMNMPLAIGAVILGGALAGYGMLGIVYRAIMRVN